MAKMLRMSSSTSSTFVPAKSASFRRAGPRASARSPRWRRPGDLGSGILRRQLRRERAALVGDGHDLDRSAEEAGDLAADGQAEARAAVLAARRAVRLLEGLEDEKSFFASRSGSTERTGVGDDEPDRPAAFPRPGLEGHGDGALRRELEGVREQVLQDLLEAIDVREEGLRRRRVELPLEVNALLVRDVTEGLLEVVPRLDDRDLTRVDRHLARFDLRQIEDLVDEREEIVARGVDGLRELHLLGVRFPPGSRRASSTG